MQEEYLKSQKSAEHAADEIAREYSVNTQELVRLEKMIKNNKALSDELKKAKEEASKYKAKSEFRGNVMQKTAATFAALTLATGAIAYGTWDKFAKDEISDPKMYKEYAKFIAKEVVPFLARMGVHGGGLVLNRVTGMVYRTASIIGKSMVNLG